MGHAHGIKWTEELIKEKIKECMDILKIERMPTNKECKQAFGNVALSNKITKTLGFKGWAEKLNLQTKESASSKGWEYEEICKKDIERVTGISCELTPVKSPYDILAGKTRIDVKMSNLNYSKGQDFYFYTFNIHNLNCGSDFYVLYCTDNGKVKKIYVIPRQNLNKLSQLSIGVNKSKYDKYINRWDLLEKHNEYLNNFEN